MAGKPGGAIITCATPPDREDLPPACHFGFNAIKFAMMEEGMEVVDEVRILGNNPCIKCGNGDTCKMSGIKMMYGPDSTVSSVGVGTFEEQPEAVAAVIKLGKDIAEKLNSR